MQYILKNRTFIPNLVVKEWLCNVSQINALLQNNQTHLKIFPLLEIRTTPLTGYFFTVGFTDIL